MLRPSRQGVVIAAALLLAIAAVAWSGTRSKHRTVNAGFWFEPVSFDGSEPMADRLGGAITLREMQKIEAVAFSEIMQAFSGFRVEFSRSREATYRMRVVQSLRHPMLPKMPAPSAESRAVTGIGGQGAVNFQLLANNAIAYAPEDADRATMVAAIGRGIGRAAAHEFAHQFLGTAPIHDSRDIQSYEYRSADRREQYYGPMRWDIARPLLENRLGSTVPPKPNSTY
jgi:hypothetical protein